MKRTMSLLRKDDSSSSCDFGVVVLVTALVIFGVVMVFSASYYKSINLSDNHSPYMFLKKQGIYAVIGFIIMWLASRIDYHIWGKLSKPIFAVGLLLLFLVLTPLGLEAR